MLLCACCLAWRLQVRVSHSQYTLMYFFRVCACRVVCVVLDGLGIEQEGERAGVVHQEPGYTLVSVSE